MRAQFALVKIIHPVQIGGQEKMGGGPVFDLLAKVDEEANENRTVCFSFVSNAFSTSPMALVREAAANTVTSSAAAGIEKSRSAKTNGVKTALRECRIALSPFLRSEWVKVMLNLT